MYNFFLVYLLSLGPPPLSKLSLSKTSLITAAQNQITSLKAKGSLKFEKDSKLRIPTTHLLFNSLILWANPYKDSVFEGKLKG